VLLLLLLLLFRIALEWFKQRRQAAETDCTDLVARS